ncbi:MAG: helicase, partial [Pseudomonadota bacterium]
QVPDYRKISASSHAEMVASLYKSLLGPTERIDEDWFAKQVAQSDRTDGDIDTLAHRIAHIRTWTFVVNRADWLRDPAHWQGRTREIEDQLSDALHERLTQRFVDQRTSALMKGMRDKDQLSAEIADDGSISVENHFVGKLQGFQFFPDTQADGVHGRATRSAAAQVLEQELAMRVRRITAAKADAFSLTRAGAILWRGDEVGNLQAGDDPLKPIVSLSVNSEHISVPDRDRIQERIEAFVSGHIADKLKPLCDLAGSSDVTGLSRGIAFRLVENFGVLRRDAVAEELKTLDQPARAQLRRYGVRFGAFNIYLPLLLKPAAAELAATLWAIKHGGAHGLDRNALPEPPRAGLTSVLRETYIPDEFYRAYGYHVCGPRAVRLDILERLSDQIRPLVSWRKKPDSDAQPPKGASGDGGFIAQPEMMSILGCSPDELSEVLKAVGFKLERRRKRPVGDVAGSAAANVAAAPGATTGDGPDAEEAGVKTPHSDALTDGSASDAATATSSDGAASQTTSPAVAVASLDDQSGAAQPAAEQPADQQPLADQSSSEQDGREQSGPEQSGREQSGRDDEAITTPPDVVAADGEASAHSAIKGMSRIKEPGVDAASADTPSADKRSVDTPSVVTPSVEEFEEIWRPRRQRRAQGAHRGRRHGTNHAAQDSRRAANGKQSSNRDTDGDAARAAHKGKAGAGKSGGADFRGKGKGGSASVGRGEKYRRNHDGPSYGSGHSSGPAAGRGGKSSGRIHTSKASRRQTIDPDSPFAALGALKKTLAAKNTDGQKGASSEETKS